MRTIRLTASIAGIFPLQHVASVECRKSTPLPKRDVDIVERDSDSPEQIDCRYDTEKKASSVSCRRAMTNASAHNPNKLQKQSAAIVSFPSANRTAAGTVHASTISNTRRRNRRTESTVRATSAGVGS